MSRLSVVFAATLAAATCSSALAHAEPGVACRFYGMNPGAPLWGGEVILDDAYAQQIASSGAHAVRIDFRLDTHTSWDSDALSTYDGIVDAAINAGLEPMGLFAYEAVGGGQSAWNDDPDQDGYNDYVDAFATASSVVIGHYASRIKRWEIWNEPSCWSNPSFASDPQNAGCSYILPRVFAKLLAEVYVRNASLLQGESIELVSGALFAHDIGGSTTTATDYLSQVYADGVWDWMEAQHGRRYPWDYLGYHPYVLQGSPIDGTKVGAYLDAVRQLAQSQGDQAAFAITEVGWTTAGVSQQVQAANLQVAFSSLSQRSDVDQAFWFSFRDAPAANLFFGITEDNGSPKEAHAAMQSVAAGCTLNATPDAGLDATSDGSAIPDATSDGSAMPDATSDGSAMPDATTEGGTADATNDDGAMTSDAFPATDAAGNLDGSGGHGAGQSARSEEPDGCACAVAGAGSPWRNARGWLSGLAIVFASLRRRRQRTDDSARRGDLI